MAESFHPSQSPNLQALAEAVEAFMEEQIDVDDYVTILDVVRRSVEPAFLEFQNATKNLPPNLPFDLSDALLDSLQFYRDYLKAFDLMLEDPEFGLEVAFSACEGLYHLEEETRRLAEADKSGERLTIGAVLDNWRKGNRSD